MALVVRDLSENSDAQSSVDQTVKEMVIVSRSNEKGDESWEEDELKMEVLKNGKASSCVIDVKSENAGDSGFGGKEFERVCRICQLSSDELFGKAGGNCIKEIDLIQLGCGCKDDMSIVHSHCAETWFKLKGNRVCEICGEAAKNIKGVREQMLVEEWNVVRFNGNIQSSSETSEGCWRGKPFCNFLMAFLVLAVIVPWLLHLTWLT